jgi:hypothetical protein
MQDRGKGHKSNAAPFRLSTWRPLLSVATANQELRQRRLFRRARL